MASLEIETKDGFTSVKLGNYGVTFPSDHEPDQVARLLELVTNHFTKTRDFIQTQTLTIDHLVGELQKSG